VSFLIENPQQAAILGEKTNPAWIRICKRWKNKVFAQWNFRLVRVDCNFQPKEAVKPDEIIKTASPIIRLSNAS
jgi:hypothetical protein